MLSLHVNQIDILISNSVHRNGMQKYFLTFGIEL